MISHTQCPSRGSAIPYRVQQAFRDKYIRLICKYLPSNKKYLLEFLIVNKELVVRDFGTQLDVLVLDTEGELCYITGCEFAYNIEAKHELTRLQKELDNAYAKQMTCIGGMYNQKTVGTTRINKERKP